MSTSMSGSQSLSCTRACRKLGLDCGLTTHLSPFDKMFVIRCSVVLLILVLQLCLFLFTPEFQNGAPPDLTNTTTLDDTSATYNLASGKNESAIPCGNRTLESGDYKLENGTLFVENNNLTLDASSSYNFTNDSVTICATKVEEHDKTKTNNIASVPCYTFKGISTCLSILLITLIVFWFINDLNCLPYLSLNIAGLLLLSALLMNAVMTASKHDKVIERNNMMYTFPILVHIILLTYVSWMSIMSSAVFYTARGRRTLEKVSGKIQLTGWSFFHERIILMILFVVPCIILAGQLLVQPFASTIDPFCWDSQNKPSVNYYAGMVFVMAVMNFEAFALSLFEHKKLVQHPGLEYYYATGIERTYSVFMPFSVLMYLTWGIGALASLPPHEWLWNFFIVLTTLEGIFIFCLIGYLDMQGYIRVGAILAEKERDISIKPIEKCLTLTEKDDETVKTKKNKIVKAKVASHDGYNQNTVYCAILVPQSEVNEFIIQEA